MTSSGFVQIVGIVAGGNIDYVHFIPADVLAIS